MYWAHLVWEGLELTTLAMIGTDCIGTFVVINPTTIWSCAHQKRGRDTSTTNIKENIFLIFKLTFHFLMKLDLNVLHNKIIYFYRTYAISAYHHWSFELEPRSSRCELDTTLCDKVYQWLAAVRWFSPGTPVSSTNKTDRHDITEILLKVPINTINKQKNISELFLLLISCSKQEFITRWPLKLSAKRWIEHVLWFFKHDVYSLAGM
jgi:hypothetical protein